MKKFIFGMLLTLAVLCGFASSQVLAQSTPLTTLDFNIVGIGLNAGPEYQAVPKGIGTQVLAEIDTGGFDNELIISQLPKDYRVKAELTGPAFPLPITLTTLPGQPFDIPTLALLGNHTLNHLPDNF